MGSTLKNSKKITDMGEYNMLKIVSFDEIKQELIGRVRKNMLIPVIGSGFTRACSALKGSVPSGNDYKNYMIEEIARLSGEGDEIIGDLKNESFSNVASAYHHVASVSDKRCYLRNNFTQVKIGDDKKRFLNQSWPYVYTLNIDDGIENNSVFNHVIYSNREVDNNIFDEEKCVVKLHGDVFEMLSYQDSKSQIFSKEQYILSLKDNKSLLSHLTNDYLYNALIYIGCSLADEIDILSTVLNAKGDVNSTRYFCTASQPKYLDKINFERYGINICIVFESYEKMYAQLSEVAEEAAKILPEDLEHYQSYSITQLDSDFESNKSYLFYGKALINSDKTITKPYFFITRRITDTVIDNIVKNNKHIQFLLGNGCSGKTYIAIDIIRRIRDRDVYMFSSRDTISNKTLDALLSKKNCLIIADHNCLKIDQIERVLKSKAEISSRNIYFIIIEQKNNRDLFGLIKMMELSGDLEDKEIPYVFVDNRFSKEETLEINQKLVVSTLGVFDERKTISDNIISAGEQLIQKNRFSSIVPKKTNVREVASLIALSIKNKVYSLDAAILDLSDVYLLQERAALPLIESENSWNFERREANNSPIKYVVNAKYWLNNQLSILADSKEGRQLVVRAFNYIITMLIDQYGKPNFEYSDKNAEYKSYILFDEINQIFKVEGYSLITEIYESLNELLANDPNYIHQRAKCYMRTSFYCGSSAEKMELLSKSYRDATIAHEMFAKRYELSCNEKTNISAAHTEYTMALALCHMAKAKDYAEISDNTLAVKLLYSALSSPYNSFDYIKNDRDNFKNVVMDIIKYFSVNQDKIEKPELKKVSELLERFIKA